MQKYVQALVFDVICPRVIFEKNLQKIWDFDSFLIKKVKKKQSFLMSFKIKTKDVLTKP